jgi:uncharacterized protein YwgA
MEIGSNQSSDLLLLLVTLEKSNRIVGRTRLQKTVFLLREKFKVPFRFVFRKYFYGPYSDDLSDVIENLVALGMVDETKRYLADGVIQYSYRLTKFGDSFLATHLTQKQYRRPPMSDLVKGLQELNQIPTPSLIANSKAILKNLDAEKAKTPVQAITA